MGATFVIGLLTLLCLDTGYDGVLGVEVTGQRNKDNDLVRISLAVFTQKTIVGAGDHLRGDTLGCEREMIVIGALKDQAIIIRELTIVGIATRQIG